MAVKSAARKPVNRLTSDDLSAFPIWEYCLDEEGVEGQDETWVRPFGRKAIPLDAWSLQVAADFTLNDGSRFEGFVDVTTAPPDDEEASSQPAATVFVDGRQAHVATEHAFGRETVMQEFVKAFARDASSIFPIKYQLKVPVHGELHVRTGLLRRFG